MSEVAGGQFRLTCGGIGTGKSYLTVKNTEEAKKKGKYKFIYSNIRAHSELAEGVLPLPDDWRECEPDSLIIIDEVQKHEKFSKHFSSRRDSEIVDLTMIRHKRQDIWMISPDPALVNSDVRNLVNQYFYLEAAGKKTTKAFCFDRVKSTVTKSVKTQAFDEFIYTIEEKYYKLYKSTEDGVASGRTRNVNMKLIGFIAGTVFTLLLIAALVLWLTKSTSNKVGDLTKAETKNNTNKEQPLAEKILPTLSDEDCRKGINVDKPECIQYFNNLTDNNLSVRDTSIKYDPSNPYDESIYTDKISYEVTAKPVFSGCMKTNGQYVAYTQQGTKLSAVSKSDCQRLIDHNDRPFNYYAKETPIQHQAPQKTEVDQNESVRQYIEHLKRQDEQAKNYVEPHLQRPINGANSL